MSTPSTKQTQYIQRLVGERQQALAGEHAHLLQHPLDTVKDAHALINALLKVPTDPDESMPEIVAHAIRQGVNKYANACTSCGHMVDVGAGYYYTDESGKYVNHHKIGACPDSPAPEPITVCEGLWVVNGTFIVLTDTPDYGLVGSKWNNVTGMLKRMRGGKRTVMASGRPATPDEVAQFGAEIGKWGRSISKCCFCNHALSRIESEQAGYGPDCASRYGLPWG